MSEPDHRQPDEPARMAGHDGLQKRITCAVSGLEVRRKDTVLLSAIRPGLAERIRKDFPRIGDHDQVSRAELARYRAIYVEELLKAEHGEFTELDRQVTESIAKQDTIVANTESEFEDRRTLGERWADNLARYGGSWSFLIMFFALLAVWIACNLYLGEKQAFDVYPFILLNLLLSCLAAIQAPIIMMSQRRQEEKDRQRAMNDYRVNLKAELEIRHLHEKMDHLITKQWERLAEIQQIQLDSMADRATSKRESQPR
jgi:uncharacterized membrane protein